MDNIKNSIIFKTAMIVSVVLFMIMGVVGWYVYDSQIDIVKQVQNDEKKIILKHLDDSEQISIRRVQKTLKEASGALIGGIRSALYNSDEEAAKDALKTLLNNDSVKGALIYDFSINDIFVVAFKNKNKIIFSTSSNIKELEKYKYFKFNLNVDGEGIGYFKVYYDTSKIVEQIKLKKEQEIKEFNNKVIAINKIIKEKMLKEVVIFLISAGIIIGIMVLLLLKLVNKPLIKFQKGLDSFFDYLVDPQKKVEPIDINTDDEFGKMSKSVNESIKISMQMHGDMAQLMQAMDKYVITSETDDKGIITYVSQAFCDISGYKKEEIIGKPHNIVRHPDMLKEVFEDLWTTIKSGKTWEGDIKNMTKNGDSYWVHTIISPKCQRGMASCGYTAIRYDITNKKEVEALKSNLELIVADRTKDLEETKKQVEAMHKHTRDSIEYASLIQRALIPLELEMGNFFKDYSVIWHPKDTVGGDIWLLNELRHKDECLLFVIDCTGHGVPGAFVTMIVKAIEREIVSKIKKRPDFDISPAKIMAYFNKTMKVLLRQETPDSVSNAGFDGGIIYYNRRTQILKFCGAETPLFYVDTNGEYNVIKGTRYSVGYKKCKMDYEYKETILEVEEGMKFYLTTDGFLDQNGGEKGFPFGKKRFGNIIKENHHKTMIEQKQAFLSTMGQYEDIMKENKDRNDDMTVISFEIGKKSEIKEDIRDELVKYEGMITQNVISAMLDNIEAKIENTNLMGTISTITIEYCQNMMNYSKSDKDGCREILSAGEIEVFQINKEYYEISAKNIISIEDKEKIEPKLKEITTLDKSEIKKRYRELRKSGANTHKKGGGIGMYEIAKVSDTIEYRFDSISDDKYYFIMKSIVKPRKRNTI